jgi:hypothetical protein
MGKAVSRGQALQVCARIGVQVNWDALDGDALQKNVIALDPLVFSDVFTSLLETACQPKVVIRKFETWKRFTIKTKPEQQEFIDVLARSGHISDRALKLISHEKFQSLNATVQLQLVKMMPYHPYLGFERFSKKPILFDDVWYRIREIGGRYCPPETIFPIMQDFLQETRDRMLSMFMRPITGSDSGYPLTLSIHSMTSNKPLIDTKFACPDDEFNIDTPIVFVVPFATIRS